MKRTIGLILIVGMLLSCTSAFAASTVNVDELKAIEDADPFGVRITKKEVQPSTGFSFGNSDNLVLTIQNDTDKTVTGIEIYVLAYDGEYQQVELGKELLSISFGQQLKPQQFSATGISISAGSAMRIVLKCDADSFTGVRAIIASYTFEDETKEQKKIENMAAAEWIGNAYADRKMQIVLLGESEDYGQVKRIKGKTVNVEVLKKISEDDNFSVKAVGEKVEIGFGDGAFMGEDALIIRVDNNNVFPIKNIVLYSIAFDGDLIPMKIGAGIQLQNPNIPNLIDDIESFTTKRQYDYQDEVIIEANESVPLRLSCDAEGISGVRLIVASYETMDGKEYRNPNAELWLNSIVDSADASYELD